MLHLGTVALDLSLVIFRLGSFVVELSFGILVWELSFGNVRL